MCSRDFVEIALVLGLWCAGTRMARWQRDGLDKSEARADAPCGGVAVAGSSTTMRRRETLRWRWRPDRTTVRWRRAAQMLGPLLGRVVIHSWRQGGSAWSLLVAREKPTARMRRRRPSRREMAMASGMTKALGLRREVGHVVTSGLAGVPGNIAREGFAVPPKPHPNSVSAVFPKLPP